MIRCIGGFNMMKNSELKMKDVIDINRGKKIGFINDVEIDLSQGRIKAFIVPSHQNWLMSFFSRKQDIVINWENIVKIGEDVVLVKLNETQQV